MHKKISNKAYKHSFHVLQVLEPGIDGVFRHVEELCYYLLKQNIRVSIAYSSKRSGSRLLPLVKAIKNSGGITIDLEIINQLSPADLNALFKIYHLCKRHNFNCIHAHSSKAGGLIRLLNLLNIIKIPVFYTPNAYIGMNLEECMLKKVIYNFLEIILAKTDAITINVSNDEKDFAQKKLDIKPSKQQVVYNSVDFSRFTPLSDKEKASRRKKLNLPENEFLILSVARVSFQKNMEFLYQAFAEFTKVHSNSRLLHIGDGNNSKSIDDLAIKLGIQDKVTRIPYVKNPEEIYPIADCFALSSRYEGLSFSVLEAIACNLPLVLSDVNGNREFKKLNFNQVYLSDLDTIDPFSHDLHLAYGQWLKKSVCNHREIGIMHFSHEIKLREIVTLYQRSSIFADISSQSIL